MFIHIYIYILELSWLENPVNTYTWHKEHRPYWVLSAVHTMISTIGDWTNNHSMQKPKLYLMSHISNAELTSHGGNVQSLDLMCLEGAYSYRGHSHLRGYIFPSQCYEST